MIRVEKPLAPTFLPNQMPVFVKPPDGKKKSCLADCKYFQAAMKVIYNNNLYDEYIGEISKL